VSVEALGYILEAWNGVNPHEVNRITREDVIIECARLCVFGSATPDGLLKYLQAIKGDKDKGDVGLTQRFQIAVAPVMVPWKLIDRKPDQKAAKAATELFERLFVYKVPAKTLPLEETTKIPVLQFDDDAQEVFNEFYNTLMLRIRDENSDLPEIIKTHLSKFRSLMPKLALIYYAIDRIAKSKPLEAIDRKSALLAVKLCNYFEAHARKIYAPITVNEHESLAQNIANRILKRALPDGFTMRDVNRKFRKLRPDDLEAPLDLLVSMGWLNDDTPDPATIARGKGRPSRIYRVNPLVFKRFGKMLKAPKIKASPVTNTNGAGPKLSRKDLLPDTGDSDEEKKSYLK
jgi:hypothetical protein